MESPQLDAEELEMAEDERQLAALLDAQDSQETKASVDEYFNLQREAHRMQCLQQDAVGIDNGKNKPCGRR